jgi:hypothetical protein
MDSIEFAFAPSLKPEGDDDDADAPLLDASSNLCSRTEDASIFASLFTLRSSLSLSRSLSFSEMRFSLRARNLFFKASLFVSLFVSLSAADFLFFQKKKKRKETLLLFARKTHTPPTHVFTRACCARE